MFRFKFLILIFFLVFQKKLVIAQEVIPDTTLFIKEVLIETSRLQTFHEGSNITYIDSLALEPLKSGDLGEVVTQLSGIHIKTYGPGSMSTPSFRGTGAAHTAVFWNGINLQGPTLGLVDFSSIPAGFIDEIALQHGSGGALFGSGAVGGAIHLNSSPKFNEGHKVELWTRMGSFNNRLGGGKATFSFKKVLTSVRLFGQFSDNDFKFVNQGKLGKPIEKLENAKYSRRGILIENSLLLGGAHPLSIKLWMQDAQRQNPSTMLSKSSSSFMQNSFYRMLADYKKLGNKKLHLIKIAYFNELLDYVDPSTQLESRTTFKSFISEIENKFLLNESSEIGLGFNNTFHNASSEGIGNNRNQNRLAGFIAYKYKGKGNRWNFSAGLRKELIDNNLIPFTPYFGILLKTKRHLEIKAAISKSYRVPTLNDLHWNPGGNINLKPEHGWSEELGLVYSFKQIITRGELKTGITFYNNYISDWIIWLPYGAYSSPINLKKVWARGVESRLDYSANFNFGKLLFAFAYQNNQSSNKKSKLSEDQSLNKQLIFVPEHSGQFNLSWEIKKMTLYYNQFFIGKRFSSSDNSSSIPSYNVSNLGLSHSFFIHKNKLSLLFRINNLLNTAYTNLPWRPMPMRNYEIGLNFLINNN